MPILAACLAVLGIVYFMLKPDQFIQTEPERIHADAAIDMADFRTSGHVLYNPLRAFVDGAYPEAIRHFSGLNIADKAYRDTAEYYLGASFLYSGRPVEAVAHFDTLLSIQTSALHTKGVELRTIAHSMTERRAFDLIRDKIPLRRNWVSRWFLVFTVILILAGSFYRWRFGGQSG